MPRWLFDELDGPFADEELFIPEEHVDHLVIAGRKTLDTTEQFNLGSRSKGKNREWWGGGNKGQETVARRERLTNIYARKWLEFREQLARIALRNDPAQKSEIENISKKIKEIVVGFYSPEPMKDFYPPGWYPKKLSPEVLDQRVAEIESLLAKLNPSDT